jgi:hypothetical protein
MGRKKKTGFIRIKWKPAALQEAGLPDIEYPVSAQALDDILSSGGQIDFAQQLYWIQAYSHEADDWESLEPASLRLTELLAPPDNREVLTAKGEDWFLEFGPVDLTRHIITIHRKATVLAAIAPREDFRLRVMLFRPLDAHSLGYLTGIGQIPGPDGNVCMRENNWQYALDSASHGTSQMYLFMAGKSHFAMWHYGLGITDDRSEDKRFMPQRQVSPLPPNLAATHVGVFYQYAPE